ncbi:MAG: hypothetical protein IPM27_04120 [Nitrosomonadales bacterium]|nr:hypothetical protein [Nitrosomonadales bacterium]
MNYQIGIVGAGIIAVYSALVLLLIVWPLGKLLKRFRWRWAAVGPVAFVLLAAPWAEEYWIARNFELACKDAGVHVYKKVEVEGFYDDTGNGGYELIKQYGYHFMEHKGMQGNVEHIEFVDGQWKVTPLDRPAARYHYKFAYQPTPYKTEERIGWKMEKLEMVVIDSETGEAIARETDYRRTINVAEGSWRLFWGLAKTYCDVRPPEHLPNAALKPVAH